MLLTAYHNARFRTRLFWFQVPVSVAPPNALKRPLDSCSHDNRGRESGVPRIVKVSDRPADRGGGGGGGKKELFNTVSRIAIGKKGRAANRRVRTGAHDSARLVPSTLPHFAGIGLENRAGARARRIATVSQRTVRVVCPVTCAAGMRDPLLFYRLLHFHRSSVIITAATRGKGRACLSLRFHCLRSVWPRL